MDYNKPTKTAYDKYDKQTRLTNFFFNLMELHNMVSLLEKRKQEYRKNPTEKNKLWYKRTQEALKRLNDKTALYADEYLFLNDLLEASLHEKQILILDSRLAKMDDRYLITLQKQYLRNKVDAIAHLEKHLLSKSERAEKKELQQTS